MYVADLLLAITGSLGCCIATIAILFFGGYGIVRGWARRSHADFTTILILSAVSALAAWMVFLIWASVFRIRLEPTTVRLTLGVALLVGLVCFAADRVQWQKRAFWVGDNPLATIALWAVLLLSVALRLFAARGLVMLPGSDAYHHTLIVQLFAEQGGIPYSYEPYASLTSFSYHFGFHSIVALFRWLFGTDLLISTKVVALVINGAIAATVGLLSEHLAGNRRAGVSAAALVGFITVTPFCLLRWSRFTQATGLFFLAPALLVLFHGREGAKPIVCSLLVAGMVVSHTRVAFFWGVLLAIMGILRILQHRKGEVKGWLATGAISLVLTAPWLLRQAWTQADPNGLRIVYPVLAGFNDLERLERPILSFLTNWPLLVITIVLAGVGLLGKSRNRATVLVLVVWCLALVTGALVSSAIGFSFWDLKTVLLSLSVPAAVVASLGAETLWGKLCRRRGFPALAGLAVLAMGVVVARVSLPSLIRPGPSDLQSSDLLAMKWIENNVPEDALFLVDIIPVGWSPGWVVGYGAGYWTPLLAHRATVVPPMIYTLEWADPSLRGRLDLLQQMMGEKGKTSSIGELLRNYGITHILATEPSVLLAPDVLRKDKYLEVIYHYDRVWVFAVNGLRRDPSNAGDTS